MGFFEQFPYLNEENLNVDWVLQTVLEVKRKMQHINAEIESVVRPMIDAQNQYYTRIINDAQSAMRMQVAYMQESLRTTEMQLTRRVYESEQKIDRTLTKIDNDMIRQKAYVESELSKSLNQMNTTLSYYKAVFDAQSGQSQAALNEMIRQNQIQWDILVAGQMGEMDKLDADVRQQLDAALRQLMDVETELKRRMETLQRDVTEQNDANRQMLQALGNTLIGEVTKNMTDLTEYYRYVDNTIHGMFALLNFEIRKKADLTYVDGQIERLENLIHARDADIQLVNPATGELDGLQKILWDIYYDADPLSLTAKEYDDLELRAREYDAYELTAEQYDRFARWYLVMIRDIYKYIDSHIDKTAAGLKERDDQIEKSLEQLQAQIIQISESASKCCANVNFNIRMHNPFTGDISLVKDVLALIIDRIRLDALTAQEYDNLQLDASDYDDHDLTAYQFDWESKILLNGGN